MPEIYLFELSLIYIKQYIIFFYRATIARRQKTFWTNVLSFIIDYNNPYTIPQVCVDVSKADIPRVSMFLVLGTSLFMLFT